MSKADVIFKDNVEKILCMGNYEDHSCLIYTSPSPRD